MGGGALGDVGGLAASLFLRGIEAWQVPTTLLAMVDSSVGGKTAVNLPEGKNLVGTVHPASRVIVDLDFVASLSGEQFHSGLAEVLKIAIGLDVDLLLLLERERTRVLRREIDVLIEIARRAIAAKIAIVEADPRDHGPRRLLNLGHTLGHALEAHAGFTSPHGHCVARGLHFALELAADLGELSSSDRDRCASLLVAYGHERTPLPPADELTPFLRRDKKMVGDRIHFVMPTAIGRCTTRDLDLTCLARQLRRG